MKTLSCPDSVSTHFSKVISHTDMHPFLLLICIMTTYFNTVVRITSPLAGELAKEYLSRSLDKDLLNNRNKN